MEKTPFKKRHRPLERLRREGQQPERTDRSTNRTIENLIVVGASAGGHHALREVIREISGDIPAAVIIMLHMPPAYPSKAREFRLEEWLGGHTHVPIVRVQSGDRLRNGAISVAPPGMSVSLEGGIVQVTGKEMARPVVTINTLFASAAKECGDRVIGVILTGLLKDGTAGLKAVHDAGGLTIVQDPNEAEYSDMPTNAMKDLPVTFCLKLAEIGPTLDLLVRRKTKLETGLATSVRLLKERVALLLRLIAQSQKNPDTFQFLGTELLALQTDLRMIEALVAKALVKDEAAGV